MIRRSLALVVLMILILAYAGCGAGGGHRPQHLILIVIDTLRADVLGCSGGEALTPSIDALAAAGTRFEHAYSHIPITGPSHSTLFTSMLPCEHGVLNNRHVLADEHRTIAEVLHENGWHTAAFISLGVLKRKFGMAQGFVEYNQSFDDDWWHSASEVNSRVLPWLKSVDVSNLFLWVHYSDPHAPYVPPGLSYPRVVVLAGNEEIATVVANGATHTLQVMIPAGELRLRFTAGEPEPQRPLIFKEVSVDGRHRLVRPVSGLVLVPGRSRTKNYRSSLPAVFEVDLPPTQDREVTLRLRLIEQLTWAEMNDRYRQEVTFVDSEVGRLIAALKAQGMWQDSVVILTSDHGEAFGEHQLCGHIQQLYDPMVQIPMILVAPGRIPAGRVIGSPVSLVDVLPTALDLLGLETGDAVRGASMVPLMSGPPQARTVVAETYRPQARHDRRAIIEEGYKYILTTDVGSEEVYDLANDSDEKNDLAVERSELVVRLRASLDAYLAAGPDRAPVLDSDLSDEEINQLEALGYVQEPSSGGEP